MTEADIAGVAEYATKTFACGEHSVHGPRHWRNVEATAKLIAPSVGAELVACRLFAVLHDCCRRADGSGPDHGPRAGQLVRRLSGSLIRLDPRLEELLFLAVSRSPRSYAPDVQSRTYAAVRGVLPDGLVTVVSVQWFRSEALQLTCRDPDRRLANQVLYRDH